MGNTPHQHMLFKERLGKQLIAKIFGPEVLAELEAIQELKAREKKELSASVLVREIKKQEALEKIREEAFVEGSRLLPELESFWLEFSDKYDVYQSKIKDFQLRLVKAWIALRYLETVYDRLGELRQKIKDMISQATLKELEHRLSVISQKQEEVSRKILHELEELKEELNTVDPRLFNRPALKVKEAKVDIETAQILLETELDLEKEKKKTRESIVLSNHSLPASPNQEEQEVEEIQKGRGK